MPYSLDLSGRVALITGASGGLGEALARALARAGAAVVLAGRRTDRLMALRAHIEAEGGDAHAVALDVTDLASIKAAVAHAETEVGPIDILVNGAGASASQRLLDVTEADHDCVLGTNARGAFFVAQTVARRMLARAQGLAPGSWVGGRIVNIAVVAGLRASPHSGLDGISQAAVVQMTRAMAVEWGAFGINVNAICPGPIETEFNRAHWQSEAGQRLVNQLPRQRLGQPADLEGLLVLLCARESRLINGAVITADDGFGL